MNKRMYSKMAWNNIKKNNRFYVPRIIAEAGLLGCFYIAVTLSMDGRLAEIKGGDYIPTLMWIGVLVLAILSVVLMLYTNSFLMKQRKNEFGLYNVLGMEKRHVGKVMFHEGLISGVISVIGGLCLGVLFYKLCSLLICKLLKSSVIIGFYFIKPITLIMAAGFFILIDLAAYVINRISIARMKPVELLASKSAGEKEPKVKWVLFVLGIISLGAGYYISITTERPIQAMGLFMLAVILVIIGTYFLFVAGSIFVLKRLKKNQKYYYNKKHMPAVSGLLYRMKQNAVGLASIAILATGVLVMISTTVSLYSGLQGTLDKNFPQDLYFDATCYDANDNIESVPADKLKEFAQSAADKYGVEIKSIETNEYLYGSYYLRDDAFYEESELESELSNSELAEGLSNVIFITKDTYKKLTGDSLDLKGNQIATCRIASSGTDIHDLEGIVTLHKEKYPVCKTLTSYPINLNMVASTFSTYGIVVSEQGVLDDIFDNGKNMSNFTKRIAVTFADREKACAVGEKLVDDMANSVEKYIDSQPNLKGPGGYGGDSYWSARESLIGMYGTLLFLGILLGAVCMFATVLIIYYKQISEGYEDRERFQIMEKVGMSKKEVRKTINSQVLLVFFLPLIAAAVHIAFAYPMLSRMLSILMLYDKSLLMICTMITFAVFAIVYILIYKGTSRTYYKIVH